MKGEKWIYVHIDLQQPITKEWCVATAWDKRYDNSDMHRSVKTQYSEHIVHQCARSKPEGSDVAFWANSTEDTVNK